MPLKLWRKGGMAQKAPPLMFLMLTKFDGGKNLSFYFISILICKVIYDKIEMSTRMD